MAAGVQPSLEGEERRPLIGLRGRDGRALPSYNLPAGAKAYVHTGSGRHYRDSSGAHHIYRGYARHVLLNTSTAKNPDLRLKKPGSPDNNTATGTGTGSITTCAC